MQKIILIQGKNSLDEINKMLNQDNYWFVSEISEPNNKGEWLVILDDAVGVDVDDDDDD